MNFLRQWFAPSVTKITPQELYARLQSATPPLILDVRQSVETRSGLIPGAINIPLTQLSRRLTELPTERPIVCVCLSNHRSPVAARLLARAGYEVLDMREGMLGWTRRGLPLASVE